MPLCWRKFRPNATTPNREPLAVLLFVFFVLFVVKLPRFYLRGYRT